MSGEPTLAATGDLSFVVVITDTVHRTAINRYDSGNFPRVSLGGVRAARQE